MKRYIGGLTRYLYAGIEPGHLLTAVLANDLAGAVCRADETSLKDLPDIVKMIYNYAPGNAWGSREKVRNYIALDEESRKEYAGYEWIPYIEREFGITLEEAMKS